MSTTEKEAATLVCPILEIRTHGRRALSPKPETCIGSKCMMWRWKRPGSGPTENSEGHCGIAGQP